MFTDGKKSKELSWNYYIFKTTKQISFNSVQSLSHVRLFVTPWTTARQASPSVTSSQNLLKLTSIKRCHPTISSSVVPFSSQLQSFPASGSFPMSQLFTSGGQNIGASASTSVLPMNIQDWFSFSLAFSMIKWMLISLQSRGSQESSPIPQFKRISFSALSFLYGPTLTSIHNYGRNHSFD